MKLFGFAVVLSFFLISGLSSQNKRETLKDRVYLKAGYSYSLRSFSGVIKKDRTKRTGYSTDGEEWVDVFYGGIGYWMNNRLSFELNYEYMNGIGYSDRQFRANSGYPEYKTYYSEINSYYDSHDITLRCSYFVNDDRRDDPIYFVGGLTVSVQPVKNKYIEEFEMYNEITYQSYYRYTMGPVAGVGIFWDTGLLSFETELTIGAKVALFKEKLSETSLSLSVSPMFRF